MNYEEQVRAMLHHLHNNHTNENRQGLVMALCQGLVNILATIPDHEQMHRAIDGMCNALHGDTCKAHKQLFPAPAPAAEPAAMTAEDFLRDVFKPEKFHG